MNSPVRADDERPPRRVLIVDDEFDIAATYSMLFEFHGFAVTTAANGEEALAAAGAGAPDIIVSDYMMPTMNGAQLCVRLRADPATRAIPFILMSAGVLAETAIPYDAFMRKPVHFELLLRKVESLLAPRG